MAKELEDKLAVKTKLIPGKAGVFKVTVNGRVLFDKKKTGRFPKKGEVIAVY